MLWCNNYDHNIHDDIEQTVILPTPGLTSGATAQVAGIASMIHSLYPNIDPMQVKAMMQRGAVPDVYDDTIGADTDCDYGDCWGGYTRWVSGTDYIVGDIVMGTVEDSGNNHYGEGVYYACRIAGTSAGTGYDLAHGTDTGCTWLQTGWVETAPDWTISTLYTDFDVVRSTTDGLYYSSMSFGTSAGDDTDLHNGSDTGVQWTLSRLRGDWETEGFLGSGRANAYRSITLWGAITDTTIGPGIVYVSGDVFFTGSSTVIEGGTTFKIAPSDIYEDEIMDYEFGCESQYIITGLTDTPPVIPDPAIIEIYFGGSIVNITGPITFESNAENAGTRDWGGIWKQGTVFVFNPENITVNNTDLGDY